MSAIKYLINHFNAIPVVNILEENQPLRHMKEFTQEKNHFNVRFARCVLEQKTNLLYMTGFTLVKDLFSVKCVAKLSNLLGTLEGIKRSMQNLRQVRFKVRLR